MTPFKKDNAKWKTRCMDAEETIELVSKAFDLIPIWALEKGQNWLPSEEAIRLLKKAKDSVRDYEATQYHGRERPN